MSKHPVIASVREPLPAFGWGAFTHPHVNIRAPISRFHPDSGRVDFLDGSSINDVDVVLFATGYNYSFPFLPESTVKISNRRVQGLYQHVFNIADPTLAFIGMVGDISIKHGCKVIEILGLN